MTVRPADLKQHAVVVFSKLDAGLKELEVGLRASDIPFSKRSYASIKRGTTKTYVTLHDPFEPGVPHLSCATGAEKSDWNWQMFKAPIIAIGNRLLLAEASFLKHPTTICSAIDVIAIQDNSAGADVDSPVEPASARDSKEY